MAHTVHTARSLKTVIQTRDRDGTELRVLTVNVELYMYILIAGTTVDYSLYVERMKYRGSFKCTFGTNSKPI